MNFLFLFVINKLLLIHIVRTHKGEGEGSSQMRTIAYKGGGGFKVAYVRKKDFFFGPPNLKTFLFCVQKKLIHCHLLLCIEKCKPALSYK